MHTYYISNKYLSFALTPRKLYIKKLLKELYSAGTQERLKNAEMENNSLLFYIKLQRALSAIVCASATPTLLKKYFSRLSSHAHILALLFPRCPPHRYAHLSAYTVYVISFYAETYITADHCYSAIIGCTSIIHIYTLLNLSNLAYTHTVRALNVSAAQLVTVKRGRRSRLIILARGYFHKTDG